MWKKNVERIYFFGSCLLGSVGRRFDGCPTDVRWMSARRPSDVRGASDRRPWVIRGTSGGRPSDVDVRRMSDSAEAAEALAKDAKDTSGPSESKETSRVNLAI